MLEDLMFLAFFSGIIDLDFVYFIRKLDHSASPTNRMPVQKDLDFWCLRLSRLPINFLEVLFFKVCQKCCTWKSWRNGWNIFHFVMKTIHELSLKIFQIGHELLEILMIHINRNIVSRSLGEIWKWFSCLRSIVYFYSCWDKWKFFADENFFGCIFEVYMYPVLYQDIIYMMVFIRNYCNYMSYFDISALLARS